MAVINARNDRMCTVLFKSWRRSWGRRFVSAGKLENTFPFFMLIRSSTVLNMKEYDFRIYESSDIRIAELKGHKYES